MTTRGIKTKIRGIRALAHDPERAHALEDQLHADVLREIANGAPDARALAAAALETLTIEFPRNYA